MTVKLRDKKFLEKYIHWSLFLWAVRDIKMKALGEPIM